MVDTHSHMSDPSNASNAEYTEWLEKKSMLYAAKEIAQKYSGTGIMWQNPYAKPRPRAAVELASVWYTAYPASVITKPDDSVINTFGDDRLWSTLEQIGIKALHTSPMKQAGGLSGWNETPSIDGHFDRVGVGLDEVFGNDSEYRQMCITAQRHRAIIIDDIIPGHTGKGADFELATMNYREYPGIYHMVSIDEKDWSILPNVPADRKSINIDENVEIELKERNYIIGKLQRIIFYEPGVKDTNWSVTRPVVGVDGVKRRWVYLHYFKSGQPTINWLDPSFAGMRLVIGDALHSIGQLGARALRLDANGLLGVEKGEEDHDGWSEGHPTSEAMNQLIGGMVRKMGGFTFQELNLSIDEVKSHLSSGADLSYDFISRPAYHQAFIKGDTGFLRLMLWQSMRIGVEPGSLVHALQNHDELTTELVHLGTLHKDDLFEYHGNTITGSELRDIIRRDLDSVVLSGDDSYNLPFADSGIACTTTSFISAALKYNDIYNLSAEEIETIKKVHLLFATFNAMQPGVFALSGWDLCGSLTVDPSDLKASSADWDTRWINRGAYDLMGVNREASRSRLGAPRAMSLYGSLPEQMQDENSFARELQEILAVRDSYNIATASLVDVLDMPQKEILVMVHKLEENILQATILNFSNRYIKDCIVQSSHFPIAASVSDMMGDKKIISIDSIGSFAISLEPYARMSVLIKNHHLG